MAEEIERVSAPQVSHVSFSPEAKRVIEQRQHWKRQAAETAARLAAVEAELNALKSRPVDPTSAELRQQLREIKHRTVFDKIASELKARPEAHEDLWKLSGYTPDTDTADETKIRDLISAQATQRAYLFTAEPGMAVPPAKTEPGPGNGRGTLVTNSGKFEVRRGLVGGPKDREWMAVNQARYHKESQAGNVEWVD